MGNRTKKDRLFTKTLNMLKGVICTKGINSMINKFATDAFRKDGNFRDDKTQRHIQQDYVKLTRFLLSHSETDNQIRPLLNNEEGHIPKSLNYSRGGNIKTGFQMFLDLNMLDLIKRLQNLKNITV